LTNFDNGGIIYEFRCGMEMAISMIVNGWETLVERWNKCIISWRLWPTVKVRVRFLGTFKVRRIRYWCICPLNYTVVLDIVFFVRKILRTNRSAKWIWRSVNYNFQKGFFPNFRWSGVWINELYEAGHNLESV
jgi:hypothetical protein